jgi:NhaA family Na+:H+ antiporter
VGFTVSIFIAGLAFSGEPAELARVGVLVASVSAALIGCAILLRASPPPTATEGETT